MAEDPTPSDTVGAKIKELRTGRGWSVRRLVDECKAIGFDVTSNVIENIEGTKRTNSQPDRRRRAISVDELLAFAAALNVAPAELLPAVDPDRPPHVAGTDRAVADELARLRRDVIRLARHLGVNGVNGEATRG